MLEIFLTPKMLGPLEIGVPRFKPFQPNGKSAPEYDYTVYRYTKSGKWIQILTNAFSVIYCSAVGSSSILCFLAVTQVFVPR